MNEFRLQRSLLKQVLSKPFTMEKGMAFVLDKLIEAPHGDAWKKCRGIDWNRAEKRWVKWFDQLLSKEPPQNLELFWFEVPSELNPPRTLVSGYKKLGSKSDAYGLDEDGCWPVKSDSIELHQVVELQAAWNRVGWWGASGHLREHLRPAVYAIASCFTALAIRSGLPQTHLFRYLKSPHGIAVVAGWAGGGEQEIGQLTKAGWDRIRRVMSSPTSSPEEFDPDSYMFNLKKYLAAGKDLEVRDKHSGATVLLNAQYNSISVIRSLLSAGADATAVDKHGCGALHRFGAAEFPILRMLIKHGADPKLIGEDGYSVLDRVVEDGRCSLAYLNFFWKRGVRLRQTLTSGNTPIHILASGGLHFPDRQRQKRQMLQYWLKKGLSMSPRGPDGLSPLWESIACHAAELVDFNKRVREKEKPDYSNSHHHDVVATILLEFGANPNDVFAGKKKQRFIPAGGSPLMVQHYRNDRLVKALLKHGANPFATCERGKTALDYARAAAKDTKRVDHKGAIQVVKVLENAMKSPRLKVKPKRKK